MSGPSPLPTQPFLGFRLAAETQARFLERILSASAARLRPLAIGYLNAAQVNLAFDDPDHARRLAAMDWLYADGQAVVWGARKLGAPIPERINAGDCTRELIEGMAARGLKLALVGGPPGEAERAADLFRSWTQQSPTAPRVEIVLCRSGYFGDDEAEIIRRAIEAADPDLVLLGMGAPRQERRALEWAPQGKPRTWWCVGALLEYYAGSRKRAPRWMRRAGLEWAVRLALEPGRLWRRYLIGNPVFVRRVLQGKAPAGLANDRTEPNRGDKTCK